MKPYYYIFKSPTYSDTHVTYLSAQALKTVKLGYKKGDDSANQNAAMNQLLEIHNLYERKADTDLKSIQQSLPQPTEPILTYQLPNPDFIKQLANKATRVKHGCIGFMRNKITFNRIWNINLSRVVEIHYKKYGYYTTREAILHELKAYATETDKCAHAISQKVAPEIKQLKELYKNNQVLLDDIKPEEVILDINSFDEQLKSMEL